MEAVLSQSPDRESAARQRIGTKLKNIRIERGVSLKELCDKTGFSPSELQNYEIGFERIPACRLALLSELFNVPVSVFFEDFEQGVMKGARQLIDSGLTLDLAYNFEMIADPNLKYLVWQLVRDLAENSRAS